MISDTSNCSNETVLLIFSIIYVASSLLYSTAACGTVDFILVLAYNVHSVG